jgi:hypothetical protein
MWFLLVWLQVPLPMKSYKSLWLVGIEKHVRVIPGINDTLSIYDQWLFQSWDGMTLWQNYQIQV